MSLFVLPPKLSVVYPHPNDHAQPLFFMFDTVHILKYIRNNWINQKTVEKFFVFPSFGCGFITTPSNSSGNFAFFNSLYQMHQSEKDELVRLAYKLSLKALCPSNIK